MTVGHDAVSVVVLLVIHFTIHYWNYRSCFVGWWTQPTASSRRPKIISICFKMYTKRGKICFSIIKIKLDKYKQRSNEREKYITILKQFRIPPWMNTMTPSRLRSSDAYAIFLGWTRWFHVLSSLPLLLQNNSFGTAILNKAFFSL